MPNGADELRKAAAQVVRDTIASLPPELRGCDAAEWMLRIVGESIRDQFHQEADAFGYESIEEAADNYLEDAHNANQAGLALADAQGLGVHLWEGFTAK